MAAHDTFRQFNASLPEETRTSVAEIIRQAGEDLLAARSEDARTRIVDIHIRDVNARMKRPEKSSRAV
jgi:hypothetical protein